MLIFCTITIISYSPFLRLVLHILLQVSFVVVAAAAVSAYFQMSNGVEGGPVCIVCI